MADKELKTFEYVVTHDNGEARGQLQGKSADAVKKQLAEAYPEGELEGKEHKLLSGEKVPVELAPQNAGKLFNVKITVTEVKQDV